MGTKNNPGKYGYQIQNRRARWQDTLLEKELQKEIEKHEALEKKYGG